MSAVSLATTVVKEVVNRSGIDPERIDEVVMGATVLIESVLVFGNDKCGPGAVGVYASVTTTRRDHPGVRVAGSDARVAGEFRVPRIRSCLGR